MRMFVESSLACPNPLALSQIPRIQQAAWLEDVAGAAGAAWLRDIDGAANGAAWSKLRKSGFGGWIDPFFL